MNKLQAVCHHLGTGVGFVYPPSVLCMNVDPLICANGPYIDLLAFGNSFGLIYYSPSY